MESETENEENVPRCFGGNLWLYTSWTWSVCLWQWWEVVVLPCRCLLPLHIVKEGRVEGRAFGSYKPFCVWSKINKVRRSSVIYDRLTGLFLPTCHNATKISLNDILIKYQSTFATHLTRIKEKLNSYNWRTIQYIISVNCLVQ